MDDIFYYSRAAAQASPTGLRTRVRIDAGVIYKSRVTLEINSSGVEHFLIPSRASTGEIGAPPINAALPNAFPPLSPSKSWLELVTVHSSPFFFHLSNKFQRKISPFGKRRRFREFELKKRLFYPRKGGFFFFVTVWKGHVHIYRATRSVRGG